MENRPLLSICIPTYNRAIPLRKCLDSILLNSQYEINKVEIVVSDNLSTDGTEELMKEYIHKYRILYNRNDKNIGGERNFLKVLSMAHGEFVKLHNDYCEFSKEGLGFLLKVLEVNKLNRPPIFFKITESKRIRTLKYGNIDEVVRKEFLFLSWISAIGFWKDEYDELPNKDAAIELQFMQTDWWLRLAQNKNQIIVCKGDIFHRINFDQNHGDFNFIKVFLNYPKVFSTFVESGEISQRTRKKMDMKLLDNLSSWYYVLNIKKDSHYSYGHEDSFSLMRSYFSRYSFWYLRMFFYILKAILKDIISKVKF